MLKSYEKTQEISNLTYRSEKTLRSKKKITKTKQTSHLDGLGEKELSPIGGTKLSL